MMHTESNQQMSRAQADAAMKDGLTRFLSEAPHGVAVKTMRGRVTASFVADYMPRGFGSGTATWERLAEIAKAESLNVERNEALGRVTVRRIDRASAKGRPSNAPVPVVETPTKKASAIVIPDEKLGVIDRWDLCNKIAAQHLTAQVQHVSNTTPEPQPPVVKSEPRCGEIVTEAARLRAALKNISVTDAVRVATIKVSGNALDDPAALGVLARAWQSEQRTRKRFVSTRQALAHVRAELNELTAR